MILPKSISLFKAKWEAVATVRLEMRFVVTGARTSGCRLSRMGRWSDCRRKKYNFNSLGEGSWIAREMRVYLERFGPGVRRVFLLCNNGGGRVQGVQGIQGIQGCL